MADRHVVLGLARSRAPWFGELARWATTAVAPIDFVKTLTCEEARAVLGTGRSVSVVLLDAELPRLDRGVISAAAQIGVPTILVGRSGTRDWESLGCSARIGADFERDELVEILDRVARRVAPPAAGTEQRVDLTAPVPTGRLVGVIGTGGSGCSTIAMALAQSWADDGSDVVLVDGCRRADLAMYHDVGDVIPGLPELVEMHRGDDADPEEIRRLEFDTNRGYRLLLGLRRPRDWAGLRTPAIAAAFDGLRRSHDAVVVDLEADLDTEADTGSADVEDRHAVALSVARRADVMLVVCDTDLKGTHGAARLAQDLKAVGTPASRIVVVANRAPRASTTRSATARAIRGLGGSDPTTIAFVRPHRHLEGIHHTAERFPGSLGRPVLSAVRDALGVDIESAANEPQRVRIGELGVTAGPYR